MRDENYLVIQGWMITKLGLSGNELLAYALIYGFTQDGNNEFTGSLQYIADWCGISKRATCDLMKKLVDKGVVSKRTETINNIVFCRYKVRNGMEETSMGGTSTVWKKLPRGMEETSTGGIEETSTNNNNIYNTRDNINRERKDDYHHLKEREELIEEKTNEIFEENKYDVVNEEKFKKAVRQNIENKVENEREKVVAHLKRTLNRQICNIIDVKQIKDEINSREHTKKLIADYGMVEANVDVLYEKCQTKAGYYETIKDCYVLILYDYKRIESFRDFYNHLLSECKKNRVVVFATTERLDKGFVITKPSDVRKAILPNFLDELKKKGPDGFRDDGDIPLSNA